MKKFCIKTAWSLLSIAGLYLMLIELGMAVSELGANILFFAGLTSLGVFLFIFGLKKSVSI